MPPHAPDASGRERINRRRRLRLVYWGAPVGVVGWFAFALFLALALNVRDTVATVITGLLALASFAFCMTMFRLATSEVQAILGSRSGQPCTDAFDDDASVVLGGATGIGTVRTASRGLARLQIGHGQLMLSCRGGWLARLFGGFRLCIQRAEVTDVGLTRRGKLTLESPDDHLVGVWFIGDREQLRDALDRFGWTVSPTAAA